MVKYIFLWVQVFIAGSVSAYLSASMFVTLGQTTIQRVVCAGIGIVAVMGQITALTILRRSIMQIVSSVFFVILSMFATIISVGGLSLLSDKTEALNVFDTRINRIIEKGKNINAQITRLENLQIQALDINAKIAARNIWAERVDNKDFATQLKALRLQANAIPVELEKAQTEKDTLANSDRVGKGISVIIKLLGLTRQAAISLLAFLAAVAVELAVFVTAFALRQYKLLRKPLEKVAVVNYPMHQYTPLKKQENTKKETAQETNPVVKQVKTALKETGTPNIEALADTYKLDKDKILNNILVKHKIEGAEK